jgi:hypothetical protein
LSIIKTIVYFFVLSKTGFIPGFLKTEKSIAAIVCDQGALCQIEEYIEQQAGHDTSSEQGNANKPQIILFHEIEDGRYPSIKGLLQTEVHHERALVLENGEYTETRDGRVLWPCFHLLNHQFCIHSPRLICKIVILGTFT